MSLAPAAIDAVFLKLTLTYGTRFTSTYPGQDMNVVKAHWAHELAGMSMDQVKHALSSLPPEFPPTVLGFRLLCRSLPPAYKALAAPQQQDKAAPEVMERINAARTQLLQGHGGIEWAHAVLKRAATGDSPRPTRAAIEMAQRALASRGLSGTAGMPDAGATE